MAAYAALVSLLNDLELIPNHPTHSFSFENKQISSLSQTVHSLIDFMETYDSHGCTREAAEVLESRIASAAHAAHDVIESHVVDQIHAGSTLLGRENSCFFLDLQKAIDHMDFVKRKAIRFKATSGSKAEPSPSVYSSEPPTSEKKLMVGLNDSIVRLMEMLTEEPSSQHVISIVGMGGLGKTTLARNAYEHKHIKNRFDIRLWATVSQEYSAQSILSELLTGERKSAACGNVSELGEELHKMLWRRRYLVVLDDMWSIDAWDKIRMFLQDNDNGSRVIVTTRLANLSAYLSRTPFEMKFLDEDKSWELFCEKALGEDDCPVELEEIGKKIVKRCGGLPLSLIVIGGHLRRSSRAIEYWEKVSNSMNPISSLGEDEQCLNIISLSYHHLPPHLKPCFLYKGIYLEDEWIKVYKLLKVWVAQGFIKPNKSRSLEEVAEDYLNDLIERNLIRVYDRNWNGKINCCIVHDIVRELCFNICKKEKIMCVLDGTNAQDISKERCVVYPMNEELSHEMINALGAALLLRSLISLSRSSTAEGRWCMFRCC